LSITRTENNAVAYALKNKCLNLFALIGGMRDMDYAQKISIFKAAAKEDIRTAVKILFYGRDARKGPGERATFHEMAAYLNPEFIAKNLVNLINLGYAKDVFRYFAHSSVVEEFVGIMSTIGEQKVRRELLFKWIPRRGKNFKLLRDELGISNKELRQMIVENSANTVERQMSKKEWDINYPEVPGRAMRKYRKAFKKHNPLGFEKWLEDKTSKASVSATYPHEVCALLNTEPELAQKLWDNLPAISSEEKPIVISDTSGSMYGLPMEVSVALGLYCSEQLDGPFKDKVITFSADPEFHDLSIHRTLKDKYNYLDGNSNWGMNTNFEKTYKLILDTAKHWNVSQDNMPTMIVCISDMQFDEALTDWETDEKVASHHELMKDEFERHGYKFPKLVYWNVRASSTEAMPVDDVSENTALISGFNPAVIQPVLNGESFNPMKIMYDAIAHIDLDFTEPPMIEIGVA